MGVLTRFKNQEKCVSSRQNNVLKVVHPRGYVEVFYEPVTANEIMRRYPGHCVARPDFFEFPWIVVHPNSVLVPGKVFYLVPYHAMYILLKSKRQQLESLNRPSKHNQSAKQQERYYRRQPYHPNNNISIVSDQESCCSNCGSLYKLSFCKSWNKMRRNLQQNQGSYDKLYDSLVDSSWSCFKLTRTGRTNVTKK